jgi:hypothetical protein
MCIIALNERASPAIMPNVIIRPEHEADAA